MDLLVVAYKVGLLDLEGVQLPKPDEVVHALLKECKESLTLVEIAERTGLPEKKVFKALRKLFEAELIDTVNRRYMIRKA